MGLFIEHELEKNQDGNVLTLYINQNFISLKQETPFIVLLTGLMSVFTKLTKPIS